MTGSKLGRTGLAATMVVLAATASGCASNPPQATRSDVALIEAASTGGPVTAVINRYRVNSGDRIKVTVYRHVDLSGEFVLDGGGAVSLPLVGTIQGGGRTARELENDIETAFVDGGFLINPQVGVQVLSYRPFYILGEVNQPGSYPYVSGMTASTAVALAGGFTARAKRSAMTISRGDNGPGRSIDMTAVVLPGDIVTVDERFF